MLSADVCQQARLSRDPRFDGVFFTAVKSTGIFCRSICPAKTPLENNVEYFGTAAAASAAGYRPCLRCRPDSAPGSPAWQGSQTTLQRALRLIDEGALRQSNQAQLADRLGISERYLRQLFKQHLGIAPKQYALHQQVLFAKKLLHETHFPIHQIALMAGFHSIRRFNDAFVKQLQLSPSRIRRNATQPPDGLLTLELSYRPPLAWQSLLAFWQARALDQVEWCTATGYGRSFDWQGHAGSFYVEPGTSNQLRLQLHYPAATEIWSLVRHIRRLLDLDADCTLIEQQLRQHPWFKQQLVTGLRIPGIWSLWEAGVRAILGQQVSITAARTHLNRLVAALGEPLPQQPEKRLFPTAEAVATSDLQMLKLPQARRQTLHDFASLMRQQPDSPPEQWSAIKGIGPWTCSYASLRGQQNTDIWLAGDLGIKKALQQHDDNLNHQHLAPWRSYATLQLWFQTA
ncbi:AlkA N-terminal domain-containing protein [Alkalimonas amylolytica]|uniref:DNA-3-methyladenine glycosylase II n=1 Tax=Alkalimonas amylolytica TaxID=152573 RepID=A0A1H4CN79_ALKAM|nr:AlkA N-terminal domain-containing protein [Alkalimonas amylolytica]SEA61768.1 DNA-3-methyladenine glycosylase II [Alkalimonas amylolytica]